MRVVVLLGPPGAGKGTLAEHLASCIDLAVFVTGDVLREAIRRENELGRNVKSKVEAGDLVDDETILALVKEFLSAHPRGVLFDGFPRTLKQAQGLRSLLSDEDELQVIYLDAEEETILKRLTGRRVCSNCGHIYNLRLQPSKRQGVCDECGGRLVQRKDDTEEVIRDRYRLYLKETAPLVDYFKKELIHVDGDLSGEEVFNQVREQLCPVS